MAPHRSLAAALAAAVAWNAAAQSPSPSPYAAVPFSAGNFVVLRLGDASFNAATAATGYPAPVYLDELTPAGAFVRSVPLPVSSCALASGSSTSGTLWNFDSDGVPQLSDNGQVCVGWYDVCWTARAFTPREGCGCQADTIVTVRPPPPAVHLVRVL